METEISVRQAAACPAGLPWMALLIWYAAVMVYRHLAAAVSAAGPVKYLLLRGVYAKTGFATGGKF